MYNGDGKRRSESSELIASTGYLLARLGMESRRLWGQMLAEFGLTPHDFGVLMMLRRVNSISQQQLGRLIGVDPRNVVALVDALEARQLVRRRQDPSDRRRHAVALTPSGRLILDKLDRAGEKVEQDLLGDLSDDERARLHHLLAKLFESRVTDAESS
jgi:DNA-binding MarR family transcriptional regulator